MTTRPDRSVRLAVLLEWSGRRSRALRHRLADAPSGAGERPRLLHRLALVEERSERLQIESRLAALEAVRQSLA
jgi:hypothetical protein